MAYQLSLEIMNWRNLFRYNTKKSFSLVSAEIYYTFLSKSISYPNPINKSKKKIKLDLDRKIVYIRVRGNLFCVYQKMTDILISDQ